MRHGQRTTGALCTVNLERARREATVINTEKNMILKERGAKKRSKEVVGEENGKLTDMQASL